MSLRIRNNWKLADEDWWEWEAYLDDDGSGELTNIERVDWILHSSFPQPVVKVSESTNGFRLATGGWGVFELKAFARTKDGKIIPLKHNLQLEYEPKTGATE